MRKNATFSGKSGLTLGISCTYFVLINKGLFPRLSHTFPHQRNDGMKPHLEIVLALLSYFGVCLIILGWILFCIRLARNQSDDEGSVPPPDDGPNRRPPRRPLPSGDRTTLSNKRMHRKPSKKPA